MSAYTTKSMKLGNGTYGCRIFKDNVLVLEGRAETKGMIGPVFRDLLRTIDKCGNGDAFTHAARVRKSSGGQQAQVKHIWHRSGLLF